jgi:hypothetical protein
MKGELETPLEARSISLILEYRQYDKPVASVSSSDRIGDPPAHLKFAGTAYKQRGILAIADW